MNWKVWAGAVFAVGALAAAYGSWSAFGPVRRVAIGQAIRHDDFVFTVRRVSRAAQPDGRVRYVVDVEVQNQAMQVSYRWSDSTAYVEDAARHRYAPASDGAFDLPAGQTQVAAVQFMLPANVKDPALRFWDGIFMGDAFDANAYGRTAVTL